MKTYLLCLATTTAFAVAPPFLLAQTSATPHRSAPAGASAHRPVTAARPLAGCAVVPPLSPKIPAMPVGTGCAKALYTITSSASQLSPMLSADLKANLEKLNQSFSISFVDTKVGSGALAAAKMYFTVNYTGYLLDGTKFDSSEGKDPITFPYGTHRVIQGWDTGFEGMHVGGKRRLFVPYQLAYGEAGRPPVIPARAMLIFDVELVSQSDQPPAPKTPPTPPTSPAGSTPPAGAPGTQPATPPPATPPQATPPQATPPGVAGQPSSKPATPPVRSTTPGTPPSPTGSTTPKQ